MNNSTEFYIQHTIKVNDPRLCYWNCIVTEYITENEARKAFEELKILNLKKTISIQLFNKKQEIIASYKKSKRKNI